MAQLTGHNLLQQVKRTISIYVTVFPDACCDDDTRSVKSISTFLPHTNYTDRLDRKCNPRFILTVFSPNLDAGADSPGCFASAAAALRVFKCLNERENEKAPTCTNKPALIQTLPRLLRILHQLLNLHRITTFKNTFILS